MRGEAASQERELRFWSSSAHKRQQAWVSVSLRGETLPAEGGIIGFR